MYAVACSLLLSITGATSATVANGNSIVSSCHIVNDQNYCFYTDGSVLSWDEAREFCERRNSTLPIITDEDIDHVFQQFIMSDSYSVIQNRHVWIDAHARPVQINDSWHWINGKQSGCTYACESILSFPTSSSSHFGASWLFFDYCAL